MHFRPRCVCSCIHSFAYGNAAVRTFGRARRHRPYAFCLRELRVDVRPYGFVWVDYTWTVDAVLGIAHRRLISFGWIACVILFVCWENGAHEPTPPVLYFCQPRVD